MHPLRSAGWSVRKRTKKGVGNTVKPMPMIPWGIWSIKGMTATVIGKKTAVYLAKVHPEK